MEFNLITLRVKAFLLELLSMIVATLAAVLLSPEFASLVAAHWGATGAGAVILLVVTGLVKHLYNAGLIKKLDAKDEITPKAAFKTAHKLL